MCQKTPRMQDFAPIYPTALPPPPTKIGLPLPRFAQGSPPTFSK